MKILIYGLNYQPELTGIGKYTGEMAEELASMGNKLRVVTALPYYPDWQVFSGYSGWKYQSEKQRGKPRLFRCPLFVPSHPTVLTRILHLLSFALTTFPVMLWQSFWKPDIILLVVPTSFCAPVALIVAVLSGAKVLIHVQDYEIDAMFGLGMMNQRIVKRIAFFIEQWMLKRFDRVSSISYSMMRKAVEKGVPERKVFFFPNWVDTGLIRPEISGKTYRDKWKIAATDRVVLYSGNIGKKQGLEIVLDAAAHFQERKDVHFLIVGQGVHRRELMRLAGDRQLSNLFFHDLQPYERLPELLAMADIHLVVQKRGAADIVLPSKLTSILATGGYTLVTAELDTELGKLCEMYPGIAHLVEPEDTAAFIEGMEFMLDQNASKTNVIARKYAEEYLDKAKILHKFLGELEKLAAEG